MIEAIKNFFETRLAPAEEEAAGVHKTDLACAALLIEVINCDQELDQRESEALLEVLQESLDVSAGELRELTELAKAEVQQATSLYEFTRLINDGYDYGEKVRLIENMWRIAFSDRQLDKYEEHLIRKIADLIYVSHGDFIQSKLRARNG